METRWCRWCGRPWKQAADAGLAPSLPKPGTPPGGGGSGAGSTGGGVADGLLDVDHLKIPLEPLAL